MEPKKCNANLFEGWSHFEVNVLCFKITLSSAENSLAAKVVADEVVIKLF